MNKHPIALAVALAFATSFALTGCDRLSNLSEQEHIQRAKDFEAKGDLKGSVIELKNAIQKNPNSPQARLLLGEFYLKSGLGAEAEKELRRAGALGMNPASLAAPIAESLLLQREYKQLLEEINLTGKESAANRARIMRMRGNALAGLGKLDEGCELYQAALTADASHVPVYWGLANCAYAKGQADVAHGHIQAALKVEPGNADTWVLLGDLERDAKNLAAAEAAYTNALKHDSGKVSALVNRGTLSSPPATRMPRKKIWP